MNNCHVLIVEDSLMNQELGRTMIETFGGSADVASNGYEAVDKFKSTRYDVIFMDCQMPVMDGFQATKSIREIEKRNNGSRAVIVALTAHDTEEDRRLCLAAGMDDHLGKPFRMQDLFQKLEKWCAGVASGNSTGRPEETGSNFSPSGDEAGSYLDRSRLDSIKSLGPEGPGLLCAVMNIYLNDSPVLIHGLREAFDEGDLRRVAATAHTLKSSSAGIGANSLGAMCKQAEAIALSNAFDGLDTLISRISSEHEKVKKALELEMQEALDG